MIFTPNWSSKIIDCDSSITDIPAAHLALRALEVSPTGMLYPPICTYKELPLGGGAVFPALQFINGYTLRFPNAGNYTISGGNLTATINPVAGVYVERASSAAYAVTAVGGGSGTSSGTTVAPDDVANAVWAHPFAATLLTIKKFLSFNFLDK
jgi:hypothetical protein